MTYRELNELFSQAWTDENGIIQGKPVMLMYKMNMLADSPDSTVDIELLRRELEQAGLSLEIA
jgi:hypothetical protein